MRYTKKLDLLLLIVIPILASMLSLWGKANFLTSTLLFFGVPAVYLSFRNPQNIKKSALFSLLIGFPGSFVIDYFAIMSGAWFVPVTAFSFRILDIIPLEDLLWATLLVFNIIMFYEYFLDEGKNKIKNSNMKYLIVILIFAVIVFLTIYKFAPSWFTISYFYLKAGVLLILLPTISFLSFFPKLISKYIKTGAYFFAQGLLFELTGLSLNQWQFNSNDYIGWVQIMSLRFPIEEFLFWMILFAVGMLSYYEFFADDRK